MTDEKNEGCGKCVYIWRHSTPEEQCIREGNYNDKYYDPIKGHVGRWGICREINKDGMCKHFERRKI